MKVITIVGTRPEIIRLSLVIQGLDSTSNQILVHTGQNFDPALTDVFFRQLGIREPDYWLGISSKSFGDQIGQILLRTEEVLVKEKPDRVLILGDTNSALSSIVAKRMGIPVFHMEAGNRCFDDRVPEEVNRRIIDHSSDVLMPYTETSRMNLIREGISLNRIFVVGNPIFEVILKYEPGIESSKILSNLGIERQKFILVTLHRAENVDLKERLEIILKGLDRVQREYSLPVIVSLHPHTRKNMERWDIQSNNNHIFFYHPFGFFDFIHLEKNALCVLSDSGTVQEECCILKVPSVTVRDVTERPETLECGSNILVGADTDTLVSAIKFVLDSPTTWNPPDEYLKRNVSDTVIKIITGFNLFQSRFLSF